MENNILENLPFTSEDLSLVSFTFSIVLSFVLSFLLSKIYEKQSNSFSNPQTLARIFPLLSIGTTIIISVIKSSLALSLGLVGALSIVRFRTPIKEPEELTYIFICVGIGLATGSGQNQVAVFGFALTVVAIFLNKKLSSKNKYHKNVAISISGINTADIMKIVELISEESLFVNFHNLSISSNNSISNLTLSFTPREFKNINYIVEKISKFFPNSSLNIIDNNIF